MNIVSSALTVLTPLAQEAPAPEDVKAGWLGFVVWIALALAVVLLALSLRKHLGRVNFPEGGSNPDTEPGGDQPDRRTSNGSS